MTAKTEVSKWGGYRVAWVQSDEIDTAINLMRNGEVDGLGLSPYSGYKIKEIGFLATVPNLQGIVLPYAKNYDLKVLERVSGLKFITVAGNGQPFDYKDFPELEDLRIEWHSNLALPAAASKLRTLYMRGFKPESKKLKNLPAFENITELEINQGNLVSLDGIEKFTKLSDASFYCLKQLQSIASLGRTGIRTLHIEACKKITDVDCLASCQELKRFRLINCGKVSSLEFLREIKRLEDFRFVNTIVEDGNMTPLLQLKSVGFLKRAGYSHTPEEIKRAIGDSSL